MIPATYNLPTGYRGDTYGPIIFKFFDASGNAKSLDGSTGYLQVREGFGISPALLWSTTDSSMLISGNQVTLNAKNGDCTLIQPKNYSYDLQLSSGNTTITYLRGSLPFINDITQI